MARAESPIWGKRRRRVSSVHVPSDKKVVLHVGCGPPDPESLHKSFRGPEWHELRLDIDPSVEPDIVDNIIEMVHVESESVDAVWSHHNIEHVYAHEVPLVLGEFFRVLRPGGETLIATPDLQAAAERIASGKLEQPLYESDSGAVMPLDMVYGFGRAIATGNTFMAHHTGFTSRTLEQKLQAAGFAGVFVRRGSGHALWATARKPR